MKSTRQIVLLLQMSATGARKRLGSYLVTVVSVTCVVGVLVAMLSMGTGVQALASNGARADLAMVESTGAQNSFASNIDPPTVATIEDVPGVARDGRGKPLASALSIVLAPVHRISDGTLISLPLYAVDPQFLAVYSGVHLVAGRLFRPGVYELIVRSARREQFEGLQIGDRIHLRGADWTIVGAYEAPGGNWNGLMGDLDTVAAAYKRQTRQIVTLKLEPPIDVHFAQIAATLKATPGMDVELHHEVQVLEQDNRPLRSLLNFVSYFVGVVMGIGATLGAINILYAVVDGRRREMATLRAIGFGVGPIVLSVLLESLLLVIPGALLGVFAAWLFFNGNQVSPAGASFRLVVSGQLALLGVIWALVMGFIGGLVPAVRAGRSSVATALRAV
jgi:putative ABC transport system permease protein